MVKTARTVSMGDETDLAAGIAYMKEQVEAQGRTRPIDIVLDSFRQPAGGPQTTLDAAGRLERMGVSWVGLHVEGKTVAEWCDNAAKYGAEILAKA